MRATRGGLLRPAAPKPVEMTTYYLDGVAVTSSKLVADLFWGDGTYPEGFTVTQPTTPEGA